MSCAYCGTPQAPGARFCGSCGRPVTEAKPADSEDNAGAGFAETLASAGHQVRGGPFSHSPKSSPVSVRSDSNSDTLFNQRSPLVAPPSKPPRDANIGYLGTTPERAADNKDPFIGTLLNGRFTIQSKLGEGGFGAVYGGVQEGTGRRVAIKVLHPEMTQDQNVVARFRREGQVLCNLRDAHTITTYDFDQTPEGTLFIAMELLEGKSLHDVFHNEAPVEWRRMIQIVSESCSSLSEAHTQGIIHRDLKPENIHLEKRSGNPEFVKILDFGIAKVVHGEGFGSNQQPQLTATGQTLGTLEYMSPEQLMGKPLDGRSDIYGLGVVTYELLTGQLPFPDATGPAALIAAQLRKVPPPLSSVNPKIPPAVDRVVLKMLEKDRNNRFADVDVLRTACAQLLTADDRQLNTHPSVPLHLPPGSMAGAPSLAGQPPVRPHPYAGGPSYVPGSIPGRPLAPNTREELAVIRGNRNGWFGVALLFLIAVGISLALFL